MTHVNHLATQPIRPALFVKPALIGGGIGLALISFFLFSAGTPNPEWGWGTFYMVRPLIISPLAGAAGGAVFSLLMQLAQPGWQKVAATIFGVLVFITGLWIGSVLGLAGTYWD